MDDHDAARYHRHVDSQEHAEMGNGGPKDQENKVNEECKSVGSVGKETKSVQGVDSEMGGLEIECTAPRCVNVALS